LVGSQDAHIYEDEEPNKAVASCKPEFVTREVTWSFTVFLRVVDYFGTSNTSVSRAPWSDVERSRLSRPSDVEVRRKVTPQLAGGSLTSRGV